MKPTSLNTGLLFGSFNPVHIGHLALANYIIEYTTLDEIWFVVSPQNPFKETDILIDERLRLEMVNIAIKNEPRFKTCDIEFDMPRPSFTIDTINKLRILNPRNHFTLIIGSDNFNSLYKWKNFEELISSVPIIVYPRPGFPVNESHGDLTRVINAPLLDISSTQIREGISEGKKLQFLLPYGVFKFIKSGKLFGIK